MTEKKEAIIKFSVSGKQTDGMSVSGLFIANAINEQYKRNRRYFDYYRLFFNW